MANQEAYTQYRISVPETFEGVFTHFYFAANHSVAAIEKIFLPSYQTILVFSFGTAVSFSSQQNNPLSIDKCLVLGPVKQPFNYTLPVGAEILVANFKADAFYRFFGLAMATETMNPDELVPENCFTSLWYTLKEIPDPSEQVNFILNFCKPYLKDAAAAIEQMENLRNESKALNPIKVMAQLSSQTERMMQLNHKKHFGYSAREIGRYERFLKAIELIQQIEASPDWFEIISQCGYYDQSQLIHDFKHFINLSPNQFLRFQQDICIANPF